MMGQNMLEALSFEVHADLRDTEDFIGSIIQKMEKILVKSGGLRQDRLKSLVGRGWSRRTPQSSQRRYNLYPINMSATFRNPSLLLSTIQLRF